MTGPQDQAQKYLETQVRTATREQLLLMLFDGAIRFAETAKTAIAEQDYEQMHEFLLRTQRIIVELMGSLDRRVGDEIYSRLIQLYKFTYLKLVSANLQKNPAFIDEALEVIQHLRDSWQMAVDKMIEGGQRRIELAPHHLGESRGLDVSG
ncbi:MAG: flagellar export chaperone FliS [Planctomycetota bacterium]|nr:MAG: flagellar export chaperone FliS [Planctomycetota bacterium]